VVVAFHLFHIFAIIVVFVIQVWSKLSYN